MKKKWRGVGGVFCNHVVDVPLPFYNVLLKFLLQKKSFRADDESGDKCLNLSWH